MQMDSRIILAGQTPDILGQMQRGNALAAQEGDLRHQQGARAMMQEYGPGIMQGDQNALAQYARYDAPGALGVQQTRQSMDESRQRLNLAYQASSRLAQELASQMDGAAMERERAIVDRAAAMITQAQTPEQFNQVLQMPGALEAIESTLGPGMATFENREMILASVLGARDALSMGQGPEPTTATQTREAQIARLMEGGLDRATAIGIADGRFTTSRHPTTGEALVIDIATGQPVVGRAQQAPQMPPQQGSQPTQQPAPQADAPQSNARGAFGLWGAAQNAANAVGDITGLGRPFPETGDTIAELNVFREQLLSELAQGYNRQPPSWLMQALRDLTPRPGSVFQGPESAVSQMRAIRGRLQGELSQITQGLHDRTLSPTARLELEGREAALRTAIGSIQEMEGRFGGAGSGSSRRTSSGVTWSVEE